MATATFHCDVVTPEKAVVDCEARFVALPAWDGEIGILRNRAPLVARLGIGELRIETADGIEKFFIDGGFAEMAGNRLTILTAQARRPEELDGTAAREQLESAAMMKAEDEIAFIARQNALERARAQIKMSRD